MGPSLYKFRQQRIDKGLLTEWFKVPGFKCFYCSISTRIQTFLFFYFFPDQIFLLFYFSPHLNISIVLYLPVSTVNLVLLTQLFVCLLCFTTNTSYLYLFTISIPSTCTCYLLQNKNKLKILLE